MAPRIKTITKVQEPPMLAPLPCPLCGSEVRPYLLAGFGLIWCHGCGLKLQRQEGLREVITFWNKRYESNFI